MEMTRRDGKRSVARVLLDATQNLRARTGLTRLQISSRPFSLWLWKKLLRSHPLALFATDLYPEEIEILLGLFEQRRPKVYLEIGVFWGVTFGKVLRHRDSLSLPTRCIGLDVWDEVQDSAPNTHCSGWPNRELVQQALLKRGYSNFELLSGLSSQVRNLFHEKIDFVFHDANHTYAAVRQDLEELYPVLSEGAMVLVHNASKDLAPDKAYYEVDGGPYRAVNDLAKTGEWKLVQLEYRVAVLQKA